MFIRRRRTRQEILDEKEEERIRQEGIDTKLAKMEALAKRCSELEQKVTDNEAADIILRDMIAKGEAKVDNLGNVTVVKDNEGSMEGVSQASAQHQSEGQNQSTLVQN